MNHYIRNNVGSSSLQILFVCTFFSIVSAVLMNLVQHSQKMSYSNNSKAADVSIGLALVTNLSSPRLCMNAVGTEQVLNLSALSGSGGNGGNGGGGTEEDPISTTRPRRIPIHFDIRGIGHIENDTFNTILRANVSSVYMDTVVQNPPNVYEAILKYSIAEGSGSSPRLTEKTIGKMKFELDGQNKFVSCKLTKI